jgi:hypothetical protein
VAVTRRISRVRGSGNVQGTSGVIVGRMGSTYCNPLSDPSEAHSFTEIARNVIDATGEIRTPQVIHMETTSYLSHHDSQSCQSKRAGTHGVTGQVFFWKLGLCTTRLYTDKRSAQSFWSSHSSNTSASDAEKRVVDHAVARSVSAVY